MLMISFDLVPWVWGMQVACREAGRVRQTRGRALLQTPQQWHRGADHARGRACHMRIGRLTELRDCLIGRSTSWVLSHAEPALWAEPACPTRLLRTARFDGLTAPNKSRGSGGTGLRVRPCGLPAGVQEANLRRRRSTIPPIPSRASDDGSGVLSLRAFRHHMPSSLAALILIMKSPSAPGRMFV